jgi:HK97 gp10 family phage protein
MATVKLEGWQDLDRALGELPKATARNTLQRALKKSADPVRAAWESKAPRRFGYYAQSIIIGPGSKLTSRQRRDAKREGKFFSEIHIGTSDPAGQQQEFGNINHPAQPSGRPAWEQTQDEALRVIGDTLRDEIEKSRARLARKAARFAGGV